MFFAYVDDSGNIGMPGSMSYTLGAVLTGANSWGKSLDVLIDFRRELKKRYGIPVNAELKANYLLRNKGQLWRLGLDEATRQTIYRDCMRIQRSADLRTFAVVIDKAQLAQIKPGADPREVAWEFLIQRLGATGRRLNRPAMIIHDEGDAATVRKIARKARRAGTAGSHFGTGLLKRPANLVDDPVPKDSRTSYFIQLADLNAYAAFRFVFPPPLRPVQIVPKTTWSELGKARYGWANKLKGGEPGLVVYPS